MAAIVAAVAAGNVTLGEAAELAKLVETFIRAIEVHEVDERLRALENKAVVDIDELERVTFELWQANQKLAEVEAHAQRP